MLGLHRLCQDQGDECEINVRLVLFLIAVVPGLVQRCIYASRAPGPEECEY